MQIFVKYLCRSLSIYMSRFFSWSWELIVWSMCWICFLYGKFFSTIFLPTSQLGAHYKRAKFWAYGSSLNAQNSLCPYTILIILLWCWKMKFLTNVLFFAVIWKPNSTSKERGQEIWGFYNSIDFTVVGYLTPNFYWFLVMTLLYHYFRRTQNGPCRALPNI